MRILLASEPGGGGVGRHVIDLAGGLCHLGHDVEIAYSPQRAESWFTEALASLRVPLHPLPMQRSSGLHDFTALRALRRLVRGPRPFDLLHGHSSKAGALLRLAAVSSGSPCLYTPHALVTMGPTLPLASRIIYGLAERMFAPLSDSIVCVSAEERQHAIDLGIDAGRLHVVNNGIGTLPAIDRNAVRDELGLDVDDVCVGFVGRLASQKAAHRLVDALADGRNACPKLVLVLVGDGEDRAELEQRASRYGVSEQVRFAGDKSGARMMAGFDIFALASRYEAFPYVFLEAAARGLPIVTTDVGGAAAVVRPGRNGYIVPQNRIGMLARQLASLGNKPAMRASMGKVSAQVAAEFTLERMVEQTLQLYRGALSTRPAGKVIDEAAG